MKPYEIRMERLKKAYTDVKKNGMSADPESIEMIIDAGLFEARQRLNTHEEYLYNMGEKEEVNYW